MADFLDLGMFVVTCGMLMLGFPVAFTLAGVALMFAVIGFGFGVFDMTYLLALPSRIYGNAMTNEILIAVPLFVYMGIVLERSRVAEELLETMGQLFGSLRGGLGISVTIVGALLAASTGIVGATVVTMGLLSLPTMMRRGYDPSLSCGAICAAGTLGQIIPPSIVLILLGDQISNAYVEAQREIGNWSPEPVSIGDLFAGAIIPGFTLVALYIAYQLFIAWWKPETSPPIPPEELQRGSDFYRKVLSALIPPLVLIVSVLGSILMGIATPTEAAAVGAVGASLLASARVKSLELPYSYFDHGTGNIFTRLLRRIEGRGNISVYATLIAFILLLVLVNVADMRLGRGAATETSNIFAIGLAMLASAVVVWGIVVANWRLFATGLLRPVMNGTLDISSLVFVILIGATLFSLVFRGLGGDEAVKELLLNLPGGEYTAVLIVMLVMLVLGFFLDFIEITFVVVPVVAPILLQTDSFSPVWLGLMMAMNLQTSFLTPPFGFALFYLRGVAPKSIKTQEIYRGVLPFIVIQLIGLGLLATFPEMADWLPRVLFGTNY